MTKHYTIGTPDGHEYTVEAPDNATQEQVLAHVRSQHRPAEADEPSVPGTFAAGLAQGAVLDPIEGIGQLVGHIPYVGAIPRFIGNSALGRLADRFRDYAQSTSEGQVGELGGAIGSMFMPMGWLGQAARAAGWAGRGERVLQAASRAGRAREAGLAAVESALGADRAGPAGFAAVRSALRTPGDIGAEAVEREMARRGTAYYRNPEGYKPRAVKADKMTAEDVAASKRTSPDLPPVGPPTRGESVRAAAGERLRAAAGLGKGISIVAKRHPVIAGAMRGATGAAIQPVVGGRDYWSEKEAQLAMGAAFGTAAASPAARRVGRAILTHAGLHGAAAMLPGHGGWLHIPLHHLARRAVASGGTGKVWSPEAQRAAGAVAGQLQHDPQRLRVTRDPKFAAPQEAGNGQQGQ